MKALIKVVGSALVAVIALGFCGCTVSSSTNSGSAAKDGMGVFNSPYSADYKILPVNGVDRYIAYVVVTVKGPAAKLAAILTDSRGKSSVMIIEKEQMISNTHEVWVSDVSGSGGEPPYTLTVKTVDPEKVVWQKNIESIQLASR